MNKGRAIAAAVLLGVGGAAAVLLTRGGMVPAPEEPMPVVVEEAKPVEPRKVDPATIVQHVKDLKRSKAEKIPWAAPDDEQKHAWVEYLVWKKLTKRVALVMQADPPQARPVVSIRDLGVLASAPFFPSTSLPTLVSWLPGLVPWPSGLASWSPGLVPWSPGLTSWTPGLSAEVSNLTLFPGTIVPTLGDYIVPSAVPPPGGPRPLLTFMKCFGPLPFSMTGGNVRDAVGLFGMSPIILYDGTMTERKVSQVLASPLPAVIILDVSVLAPNWTKTASFLKLVKSRTALVIVGWHDGMNDFEMVDRPVPALVMENFIGMLVLVRATVECPVFVTWHGTAVWRNATTPYCDGFARWGAHSFPAFEIEEGFTRYKSLDRQMMVSGFMGYFGQSDLATISGKAVGLEWQLKERGIAGIWYLVDPTKGKEWRDGRTR